MILSFRKIIILLFSVFTLSLLNGCAFGTRSVILKNSEPPGATVKPHHNHEICFNGLSDSRRDSTIGHVQNGYGMRTAEVVAANSVPEWVNKEIKNQLEFSGYVVNDNCGTTDDRLVIDGKIVKVYTTAYMTYLGEVTIKAQVSLDSTQLLNKTYTGYNKSGTNWAATAEVFRKVLDTSLKASIKQLIKDIDSIDNNTVLSQNVSPVDSSGTSTPIAAVADSGVKYDTLKCPQRSGGIVIIRGKRTSSDIIVILDNIRTELNSVYNERFELNPSLSGDVCVRFIISPAGEVKEVIIIRNSLNDVPIESKLLSSLSKAHFNKISSSDDGEVLYNVSFKAESARASKSGMVAVLAILAILPLIFSMFMRASSSPY